MKLENLRKLTPAQISRMTEAEARRAYSELRSGFKSQLARLEQAGYKREITQETFKPLAQVAREDVKSELQELTYWSRQGEYRAGVMRKRTQGLQHWMQEHGHRDHSYDAARRFGEFMGSLREQGITAEIAPKRYITALEEAKQQMNNADNAEDLLNAFDEYEYMQELEDTEFFEDEDETDLITRVKGGGVDGFTVEQAQRHKKALKKYRKEIGVLTRGTNRRYTEKDVNNLIRRARRMHNRKL